MTYRAAATLSGVHWLLEQALEIAITLDRGADSEGSAELLYKIRSARSQVEILQIKEGSKCATRK